MIRSKRGLYPAVALLALLAAVWLGCSDDESIGGTTPALSSSLENYRYPLALGNTWEHEVADFHHNFRPAALAERFPDTVRSRLRCEVIRLDTVSGIERWVLQSDAYNAEDMRTGPQLDYYEVRAGGLYHVGNQDPQLGTNSLPKPAPPVYRFADRDFAGTDELTRFLLRSPLAESQEDTMLVLEPPHKCLPIPMSLSSVWTYAPGSMYILLDGTPFHQSQIDRKVTGWERVAVPAGEYDCFVVEWMQDDDFDGAYETEVVRVDYFAAEGLAKQAITARDVIVYGYGSQAHDSVGVCDITIQIQLTSANVQL